MNAADGGRRREVGTGQNCIVYLSESGSLCISIAFASGEEGWYFAIVHLGTIHILRKHLYSTKLNLTSKFFTKTGFFCQNKRISFSTVRFDEIFML